METRQLKVKAVLQYPEGLELGTSPDVKCFSMIRAGDDVKADLYKRLLKRLSMVFPDIVGVNYSLYWKDAEGDLVQFSSLEELQTAVDAMLDHVLPVYVIVHFDEIEETTDEETAGEEGSDTAAKKGNKRVRFARAGRKFRRRIRRRRRSALSDPNVISKEYRTGARALIRRLHKKKGPVDAGDATGPGGASLAQLSPNIRDFIQKTLEEYHSKLATQRPTVAAKRMRMKTRTLPPGLERDHFLWLLRLIGRWHRRHAGQCDVMSGWSSGDTDADESGGEELLTMKLRSKRKRERAAKRAAKGKVNVETEEAKKEGPSSQPQQKVAREFRQAVRILMKRIHKTDDHPAPTTMATDGQGEGPKLAKLAPEVQTFIQKVAEDWHTMLKDKRPSVVAKRMRKRRRKLPGNLQREHYLWLCRYFRRWHGRNAAKCSVMAGWSSGEDDDNDNEDEYDNDDGKEAGGTDTEGAKEKSSESEAEDSKKAKKAVEQTFAKAARLLVNRHHNKNPIKKDNSKKNQQQQEEATLAALSPEARAYVQNFATEWDKKLENKSPLIVAKRMRMRSEKSDLPPGIDKKHVHFLCRLLSRWHEKHATSCVAMGSWSSAETGGDTSEAGEGGGKGKEARKALRRRAKRAALVEVNSASEQEDTDCVESACKPVPKDFRAAVRQLMNQIHKQDDVTAKPTAKGKEKTSLPSPEVERFLRSFMSEWHQKLSSPSSSGPAAVSKEMKKKTKKMGEGGAAAGGGDLSLPAGMEADHYRWLCCFTARWHGKHNEKCAALITE